MRMKVAGEGRMMTDTLKIKNEMNAFGNVQ